jgi:hypothetical protein
MTKILGVLAILLALGGYTQAQSQWDLEWDIKSHDVGQLHWQVGFGLPRVENTLFRKYQGEIDYNLFGAGPFNMRLEYGLSRRLSFSAGVLYTNYKCRWTRNMNDPSIGRPVPYEYGVIVNNYAILGRINYHMYVDRYWDVYLGGGVGYDMYMSKDYTKYSLDSTYKSYFKNPAWPTFETGFGVKYFALNRTAFYAEVGYGKSYAQIGVVIKVAQPRRNRVYSK